MTPQAKAPHVTMNANSSPARTCIRCARCVAAPPRLLGKAVTCGRLRGRPSPQQRPRRVPHCNPPCPRDQGTVPLCRAGASMARVRHQAAAAARQPRKQPRRMTGGTARTHAGHAPARRGCQLVAPDAGVRSVHGAHWLGAGTLVDRNIRSRSTAPCPLARPPVALYCGGGCGSSSSSSSCLLPHAAASSSGSMMIPRTRRWMRGILLDN